MSKIFYEFVVGLLSGRIRRCAKQQTLLGNSRRIQLICIKQEKAGAELTSLGSDVGTASSLNALEPEAWRCGGSICAPTFSSGWDAIFDGCLSVCLCMFAVNFLHTMINFLMNSNVEPRDSSIKAPTNAS